MDESVSYSIKELLSRIESKLDYLDGKLDGKADRADLVSLEHVVDRFGERLANVEKETELQARSHKDVTEWRRWLLPTLITLAALVVGILQVINH